MRVQLPKFTKLLDLVSMNWQLELLELDFTEAGIKVEQTDTSMTYGVFATIFPTIAEEYEAVGKVKLTSDQVKLMKKMFRADDYVDFKVEEGKIVVKGSEEELELEQVDAPVYSLKGIELVTRSYGTVLAKPRVQRAFLINMAHLADVGYERKVKFEYGDALKAIVDGIAFRYTKLIPHFRAEGEGTGSATLLSDVVEAVANVKEKAWIIFTQEPVEVYYEGDELKVLYVLSQVAEI